MSAKRPPVPPHNRSGKAPPDERASAGKTPEPASRRGRRNLKQQGRHGNIKQNTTNQGYQQDR
jgi:hypothetical protein